ncbi:hypothetical protein FQN57_004168 [Myotisia sp. PD_48]|nr:hypothetical protein FQN57_004168 [Myotisia sp. PD_48]
MSQPQCQFETLKRCPQSDYHLHQCLQSLPLTLNETYERMLCNIDETMTAEAQRILTLICFSARPLTVADLKSRDLHSNIAKMSPRQAPVELSAAEEEDQMRQKKRRHAKVAGRRTK